MNEGQLAFLELLKSKLSKTKSLKITKKAWKKYKITTCHEFLKEIHLITNSSGKEITVKISPDIYAHLFLECGWSKAISTITLLQDLFNISANDIALSIPNILIQKDTDKIISTLEFLKNTCHLNLEISHMSWKQIIINHDVLSLTRLIDYLQTEFDINLPIYECYIGNLFTETLSSFQEKTLFVKNEMNVKIKCVRESLLNYIFEKAVNVAEIKETLEFLAINNICHFTQDMLLEYSLENNYREFAQELLADHSSQNIFHIIGNNIVNEVLPSSMVTTINYENNFLDKIRKIISTQLELNSSEEPLVLIVDIHGGISEEKEHILQISNFKQIKTKDFIEILQQIAPGKAYHLHLLSCYGGMIKNSEEIAEKLPQDSCVISYAGHRATECYKNQKKIDSILNLYASGPKTRDEVIKHALKISYDNLVLFTSEYQYSLHFKLDISKIADRVINEGQEILQDEINMQLNNFYQSICELSSYTTQAKPILDTDQAKLFFIDNILNLMLTESQDLLTFDPSKQSRIFINLLQNQDLYDFWQEIFMLMNPEQKHFVTEQMLRLNIISGYNNVIIKLFIDLKFKFDPENTIELIHFESLLQDDESYKEKFAELAGHSS